MTARAAAKRQLVAAPERRPEAHVVVARHRASPISSPSASSTPAMLEEIEDVLIRADLGVEVAAASRDAIGQGRYDKAISPDEVKAVLAAEVEKVLQPVAQAAGRSTARNRSSSWWSASTAPARPRPSASSRRNSAPKASSVMLAAGDTFRAAAIDQLKIWGERVGAQVVAREPGVGCGGPRVRRADQARKAGTPTCCWSTPPAGCRIKPS